MNIQISINDEPYTGKAFKAGDGLVIHLPGVQAPHAAPLGELFQPLPENKTSGGFLEVGKWDGGDYEFETQVDFRQGPDGKVWAQICDSPDELPDMDDRPDGAPATTNPNEAQALRILDEAEEAFGATSMAEERAANGGWPQPMSVPDYLCYMEHEAGIQEEQVASDPDNRQQTRYAEALRGVACELRALGYEPSPAPWPVDLQIA